MDTQRDDDGVAALAAIYEAKAAAELSDADRLAGSDVSGWQGHAGGPLLFVVAAPVPGAGPDEPVMSGPVAEAAIKAAAALGVDAGSVLLVASRPVDGLEDAVRSRRLALAIEASDPRVVIAIDEDAAADLAAACATGPLTPGSPVRVLGRVVGAAGSLGASLGDEKQKRLVWRAMRAVAKEAGLP